MEARVSREGVEGAVRLLDGGREVYPAMLAARRGVRPWLGS